MHWNAAEELAGVVVPLPGVKPKARLVKTRYANLWRDRFSGTYFCIAKVCGQPLRKSLETRSIEIAKAKLDELISTTRAQRSGKAELDVDEFRFAQLADVFAAGLEDAAHLKPRSKAFRVYALAKLKESWPELVTLRPRQLTPEMVEEWAEGLRRRRFSGGLFNSIVDTLRMVCDLAVDRSLMARNPVRIKRASNPGAKGIVKARVQRKLKPLPADAVFRRLIRQLEREPKGRQAWWRVRVLAYSGERPENVRRLRPADVDLKRDVVHWPPIKHNAAVNTQPLNPKLRAVFRELLKAHPGDDTPLVPTKSARRALATASKQIGLAKPITEGVFRHWVTTRLLDAGIPAATVAQMRGDKDGGAMLLRTYSHARVEVIRGHTKKMKW